MEEAEYLATLSNFHWFVYPFFKTIEVACDKIFGCKKHAEEYNEKRRAMYAASRRGRTTLTFQKR